jgi:uncharacterized protein
MRLPVVAGVVAAWLALAAPAYAHVTVSAPDATPGGEAALTTKTAQLTHPITTDDGDQVAQAVSEIDWSADTAATAIKPGEFDQFVISAGLLPKADTVTFRAIQVYSDGSQVHWIDVPAPGSTAEPEHPAPTLKLAVTNPAETTHSGSSQTGSVVLASIALALAVVALGVAVLRRRTT